MNRKKLFSIIILLLIVAAIPFAVFLSQQQQELRQRAGTEGVTFSMVPDAIPPSTEPTTEAILNMVDSTNSKINSFDITLLSSSDNLIFTDFTDVPADFEKLVSNVEDGGKKLHVIAINQHGTFLTGTRLGVVRMQKKNSGSATISLDATKTIITAKGSDSPVLIANTTQQLATYTVASGQTQTSATVVTGLIATCQPDGTASLNWNGIGAASSYTVNIDNTRSTPFDCVTASSTGSGDSCVDTTTAPINSGSAPSTPYRFWVIANYPGGVKSPEPSDAEKVNFSCSVGATNRPLPVTTGSALPAPTNLTATCSTNKTITISWDPYSGENDGYFVILDKNPPSFDYEHPANDDSPMIAGATTIQPGIELEPGVKYAVDAVIIPKGMQYQQTLKYNPPASQHARKEFTCP